MRVWRLRSYLAALLVATILLTFAMVGGTILLVRISQIEQANKEEVARDVGEISTLVEVILGSLEARMELLSQTLDGASNGRANALLDRAVGDGQAFRAIYLVSRQGTVRAAGVAHALPDRRDEVLGSDLSGIPLFRAGQASRRLVWGDKYLSAMSGTVTAGLVVPVGDDQVLLAEVPLAYLLSTFQLAAGSRASAIWLVDRQGEIVADNDSGSFTGTANMLNSPLMLAQLNGLPLPDKFSFMGHQYHPAISYSKDLDWYFIGGMPARLENKEIRRTVVAVVGGFAGVMLIGLLLAPYWATWLSRPLRSIVERAAQITQGAAGGTWPRGAIEEFNHLSAHLEKMATEQHERGQKIQAIFNASPVPMSVTDGAAPFALQDVNDAWCTIFDRRREDVLGRSGKEINLWVVPEDRTTVLGQLQDGQSTVEAWLRCGDGQPRLFQLSRQWTPMGTSPLMVWAAVDITNMQRIESELRTLNTELEARVQRRTEALASLNAELSGTVATLQATQSELVQAEKMAALGSLVAGVAHELNTPLGNGLMAVSALADEVRQFRQSMQDGLRRSALEALLAGVEQGTSIATRNLHRAADLVTSFKQVAVDQTSAQRRRFALVEVVTEILASLRPTLGRTPYQTVVDVPADLQLDSYPGALGQVIANLVTNAVVHGFEDRTQGCIRMTGTRVDGAGILLCVADDGHGIPATLLDRIFDPFVTTKMGRGGTGLGLHISYNAVVNVMGGSLSVHSVEGEGTVFELRLPVSAPHTAGPLSA